MKLNRTFNQEECTNIIINYIVNKKEKQALLIDGDWGSGKTFFINKFINDIGVKCEDRATYLLNNQKKITLTNEEEDSFKNKNILPIISLYGLNSIDEIRFKIFKTHIPLLSKGDKKTDLCIDFFASNFVNIVKLIKPEVRETLDSLKFENINKVIETLNLTRDKVIIFDDLERCNIELSTLFGYINELMEEDNTKVILISNEKEIINSILYKKIEQKYLAIGYLMKNNTETNGAKDGVFNLLELKTGTNKNEQANFPWEKNNSNEILSFNHVKLEELNKLIFAESKSYNKIKEKIIGTTINFSPDIYKDFENIIKQYIDDDDIIRIISSLKPNIINILTNNKFFNYRCLIFWFTKINKILTSLKQLNIYNSNTIYIDELKKNIIKCTLFYAIQIKKNNKINPDFGSKMTQNNNELDNESVTIIGLSEEDYSDFSHSFLSLKHYMLYGYFDINTFKEEIDIFIKIQEDQNDLGVIVYKINRGLLAFSKEELREQLNRILNRLQKTYESDIQSYNILFELVFSDLLDNELIEYALGKNKDEYVDDIVQLMIRTLNQSKITIGHINVNTNITHDTYKEKIKMLNTTIDRTNLRINKLEANEKISKYVLEGDMKTLRSFLYYNNKFNYLNSFDIHNIQQFINDNIYIEGNNENFGLFIYIISQLNEESLDAMNEEKINKYYTDLSLLLNKLNELIEKPIKDKIKKQGLIMLINNLKERKNTLDNYNNKGIK